METYYYFFFFAIFFAIFFQTISKKIAVIIMIVMLSLFAGTRVAVDNDYLLYKEFFQFVNGDFEYFKKNFNNLELSIFIIPNFLRIYFISPTDIINGSFLLFAIIAVSLKLYSIKKYSNYFLLSFIFYLSSLFFMHEMTTIRAGVAAGILLLSIQDFERKNTFSFSIKMSISLLFHYSSVLVIICYIFMLKVKKIKYYYYGLVISFVIAITKINVLTLLFLDRLFPKVKIYLELQEKINENKVNIFNFKILFSLFILLLFSFQYKKLCKIKYFDVLYKLHILSILIFFALSPTAIVFSIRSFELISIVQVLLAPMILYLFSPKFKYIGVGIVLVFSAIQLYYIISVQDIFRPYQSWFF